MLLINFIIHCFDAFYYHNYIYKILLEWTKSNYCPLTSLEIIALISNNIKKLRLEVKWIIASLKLEMR